MTDQPHEKTDTAPPANAPRGVVGRAASAVRTHPLLAAAAGLGLVGAAALGVLLLQPRLPEAPPCAQDGSGYELAPGVVVTSTTGDRVVVQGPANVCLFGTLVEGNGSDWSIAVDGGSGVLGDVVLKDDDFGGSLRSVAGAVNSTVSVAMSQAPQLIDGWDQRTALGIDYVPIDGGSAAAGSPSSYDVQARGAGGGSVRGAAVSALTGSSGASPSPTPSRSGWQTLIPVVPGSFSGTVKISTSRGQGSLSGSGTVAKDGTFTVDVSGTMTIGDMPVSLSGSYSSAGWDGNAASAWTIQGDVQDVQIKPDLTVLNGYIAASNEDTKLRGTVRTELALGSPLDVEFDIEVADEDDWRLTVSGTTQDPWSTPAAPGLVVDQADITGTVTDTAGEYDFSLTTSATLAVDQLTTSGRFEIDDPGSWTYTLDQASGTVLAGRDDVTVVAASGSVEYAEDAITGELDVEASGSTTVLLPSSWSQSTTLRISYDKAAEEPEADSTVDVDYEAQDGRGGLLSLTGAYVSPDAYRLEASGTLVLGQGGASIDGWYESAGWADDVSVREEPAWLVEADLSDVSLGSGAQVRSGSLQLTSEEPGFNADIEVQPTVTDPFSFSVALDYTDGGDWDMVVKDTQTGPDWTVANMGTLTIPPSQISGEISATDGSIDWSLTAAGITWADISDGVTMSTDFVLGPQCPLEEDCPALDAIYLGFVGGSLDFPSPVPHMTAQGAVASTGTWARFEADAADTDFGPVSMSDAALTIWYGPRSDSFEPSLEMPDLSASNKGFGIEFCGDFTATIPLVGTKDTGGCSEWSPQGTVVAQVDTGGDVDPQPENGVDVKKTTVNGWAWTDLATKPVVALNGIRIPLPKKINQITAEVVLPGNVMKALGQSGEDTTIAAQGWYDDGDFSLDGSVDTDLSNQGMELDAIVTHIGRQDDEFTLSFEADGAVKLSGNKFPLSAYVGLEVGSTTDVVVRLTAKGAQTAQPEGTFDIATLLPSGTFEPGQGSLIDGSFDTKPPASILADGDFEDAGPALNLVSNGDLEEGTGTPLIPNGDFEDGTYANFLTNGDLEDTDQLVNGDFDNDSLSPWTNPSTSAFTMTAVAGSAPTTSAGSTILSVKNLGASGTTQPTSGIYQNIPTYLNQVSYNSTYTLSAWVYTPDASAATATLSIVQTGTYGSCSTQTDQYTTKTFSVAPGAWTQISMTAVGNSCHTGLRAVLGSYNGGHTVQFDAATFALTTAFANDYLMNTERFTGTNALVSVAGFVSAFPHSGSNAMDFFTTAAGGYASYDTKEAPVQGATYSFSAWVYGGGAGSLTLTATGGVTPESMTYSFTPTASWQQVVVSLPVLQSGHTSLVAKLTGSVQGAAWWVDDMVVQQLPWTPYVTGGPIAGEQVVYDSVEDQSKTSTSLAHAGTGALELGNPVSGQAAAMYYDVSRSFPVGTLLSASVWMRSAKGTVTAALWMHSQDGTTDQVTRSVTLTSSWQLVSVSMTTRYAHSKVRLEVDNNTSGTVLALDDVTMLERPGLAVVDPGDTTGAWSWCASSSCPSAATYYDDSTQAHAGNGYVWSSAAAGTAPKLTRSVSVAAVPGQTYVATAWVKGAGTGSVKLAGAQSSTQSIAFTGSWQQVTVSLPITSAGQTSLTLTITGDPTHATTGIAADDASISLLGLSEPAPWTTGSTTGGTLLQVIGDPTTAHGGDDYLETTVASAPGSSYKDSSVTVAAGSQYTASAWVRSSTSTTVTGSLKLTIPGSSPQAASVPFTAGPTWQQVFVTTTSSISGPAAVRAELGLSAPGTVLIDDVVVLPDSLWGTTSAAADRVQLTDREEARDGTGYLRVSSTSAGQGVSASGAESVAPGSEYVLHAFVRAVSPGTMTGTLRLSTSAGEKVDMPFTAGTDWQDIELTLNATKSASSITESVLLGSAGVIEVDSVVLTRTVITQQDPWTTFTSAGTTVSAAVHDDPAQAHTDSGSMLLLRTGTSSAGVFHDVTAAPSSGTRWSASAWLRADAGSGTVRLALSGNGCSAQQFADVQVAAGDWQYVSVDLPISVASCTGLRVTITALTSGFPVHVDDVVVQPVVWDSVAAGSATAAQTLVNDSELAQSGSGFLRVTASGSGGPGVSHTTSGAVPQGSVQTVTAWVRSSTGAPVDGRLVLTATGGAAADAGSAVFTATDEWQKVTAIVDVAGTGQDALVTQVLVDDVGVPLDLDTVGVDPDETDPDGITEPLPHPETGYAYLWDDAFGIPGAHLWAVTGQIEAGTTGASLGIGATLYFDPTKAKGVMTGTEWLKGDLMANISTEQPCYAFGFDGTGTGTAISIEDGLFTASKFELSYAPRGCEIGEYALAPGSVLAFDASLGTAQIHFDMEIGRDDNDLPTFSYDEKISDVVLGGVTYNSMELSIELSEDLSDVSFVGDFTLPMGQFYGSFDLSMNAEQIHMDGQVSVSDWKMSGGSGTSNAFDVDEFDYRQVVDIPLGADSCATIDTSTSGDLHMGSKSYAFTGELVVDCGTLKTLQLTYTYHKKNVGYSLQLDYDSSTHVLSGGLQWKFERYMSWKYLSHKYVRHPKIAISLWMTIDFDKPSDVSVKISGKVSVASGSGSFTATYGDAYGDDGGEIKASVTILSYTKNFKDTW